FHSDPMGSVYGLVFDGRVPPAVEEEYVFAKLKVEADAPRTITHKDNVFGRVVLELFEDAVALLRGNFAVILQRTEAAELVPQDFQALHPLAEDDRLLATGGDFLQVGFESLQFRAGAGSRIEIANLLEPQDQLENVLDGDFVAEMVQLHDPFGFGHFISGSLRRREIELGIAIEFGGHVRQDLVLCATKDVVLDELAQSLRAEAGAQVAGREEFKDADQV